MPGLGRAEEVNGGMPAGWLGLSAQRLIHTISSPTRIRTRNTSFEARDDLRFTIELCYWVSLTLRVRLITAERDEYFE